MTAPEAETELLAVTGNDLLSGRVVYLDRNGVFVDNLADARVFSSPETAEASLKTVIAAPQNVIDLHVMTLTRAGGMATASGMREHIRQHGPTTVARGQTGKDSHV